MSQASFDFDSYDSWDNDESSDPWRGTWSLYPLNTSGVEVSEPHPADIRETIYGSAASYFTRHELCQRCFNPAEHDRTECDFVLLDPRLR